LAGQLARQAERLGALEQKRAGQQAALREQQGALAAQVRAAYAMGRQERLKILLNQQDPAELGRVMAYYEYFNRVRASRIRALSELLEQLAQTEASLTREQERLRQFEVNERQALAQLEAARSQRHRIIEQLQARIQDQAQELNRLKQDEQKLRDLIEQLSRALADLPVPSDKQSFPSRKGKLGWPVKGSLAARFGSPRKIGNLRWDGTVIAAAEGTEVRAVHYGRVIFAGWLRGFGLMLIIDHGDGYMSLYGYNQVLFKEVGEWVEPGERVALVGNSGGQLNAGVYFGIRHNGKPVNPQRWCLPAKGRRVGSGWHIEFPLSGSRVSDRGFGESSHE
jgi:septal ring factor EnvC (AmiA/AmiB activator)